jgi:hypothetical protein
MKLRELYPATLPGDDLQHFSDLIRSIETRTNMSWRVFYETKLALRVAMAASREYLPFSTVTEEPFQMQTRLMALALHWVNITTKMDRPGIWEEQSATIFLPPLLPKSSLGEQDQGQVDRHIAGDFKLVLSPEQDAKARAAYTRWRGLHDRAASYFQAHPPTPSQWEVSTRSNALVHREEDSDDEPLRAKYAEGKMWVPIYKPVNFLDLPAEVWEPRDDQVSEWLAETKAHEDAMDQRRERQMEYLRARMVEKHEEDQYFKDDL